MSQVNRLSKKELPCSRVPPEHHVDAGAGAISRTVHSLCCYFCLIVVRQQRLSLIGLTNFKVGELSLQKQPLFSCDKGSLVEPSQL